MGSRRSPSKGRLPRQDRWLRNTIQLGRSPSSWGDLYHLLLTLSWPGFLALFGLLYIAVNALFALVYLAGGNGIENAQPGSFSDAFFFSVQTLAGIGYGAMHPRTFYVDVVVTVEALIGLLGLAMATGLAFSRFARPTARVLFSRVAVITAFEGVPTLMFRAANQRRNQILEAQLQVSLIRDEVTQEGHFMRRFHELKLVHSRSPVFALTWTAMHPIDRDSPLYQATPESLAATDALIIISLTGLDETVSQTIHARHAFAAEDILWNVQFVDVLSSLPDGRRIIDYTRFHDVRSLV